MSLYPRTEYEMTEDDLRAILDACKPTPVMYLSGGRPLGGSPQENANRAWAELGERMGFDWTTVRPSGKGGRFFTAVPSEPEPVRIEREKREAEAKRATAIAELEAEIAEKTMELEAMRRDGGAS